MNLLRKWVGARYAGAGAQSVLLTPTRPSLTGGTAAPDQPSSGQHSPARGETITGNRNSGEGPLTGGEHQLPLRFASPEQKRIDSLI